MNVFSMSYAPCALLRAASRRVATAATTTPTLKVKDELRFGSRWLSKSSAWSISNDQSSPFKERITMTRSVLRLTHRRPSRLGRRTIFSASKSNIILQYEYLPKDYRDNVGLQFNDQDLSDEDITHIFGRGFDATTGNHLLRILHGRRVAGTLEDPAYAESTAKFPPKLIDSGLKYLREKVPVNELLNAGLRAEDELNQMDQETARREAQERRDQGIYDESTVALLDVPDDPVYGKSELDKIRARNIARQKALDRAAEEKRLAREAEQAANGAGPLVKAEEGRRAITNPKVAEYYLKAQSDLQEPPEMKAWERILPSVTVVALVLGFLGAVAMVYEEPMPRYRLLRDISTAHATVGTVIALNALVFLCWRIPPLWAFFNKYMITVVATIKPATLFTSTFSHSRLTHLLSNMLPLWFVGTAVHEEHGRAEFLALYLGCGALGFLGSLVTYTMRGWLHVTSLGASGATLGLSAGYFWEHRNEDFRILDLPPDGLKGIVLLALLTAVQIAAFGRTAKLQVDIASHVSSMVAGILGIEILNKLERWRDGSDKVASAN
ncbi:hypothetical protein E4U60_004016 [Claviceps pazoutovae]|uniref:Peptidase S54 rhomboid domain-containing protein n=1 Tax=Claviceps pazoutovae TaxID=1649127 RepID=A0A9P7M9G5_9HYPO|nr:hypothetical protein E4U60_004016 [Claviceps pazoutovae]